MKIACTIAPGRGTTDLLLSRLAERLMTEGFRPCGIVQINTLPEPDGPCDMDVRVLPDGPVIRISQSLGRSARGCRLDPEALERAAALVQGSFDTGADLMIVNKFGKHEADGRGFRPIIGEALARGLPVLVGLNASNVEAFRRFTAGEDVELAPDVGILSGWLTEQVRLGRDAA